MRGKNWLKGFVWAGIFCLVATSMSYGAGFALYEGSARGNALGGAMVGRADDPSAIYYNPAGITQLEGFRMMAGGTVIVPNTDIKTIDGNGTVQTTGTETNFWDPPHFYASYQFSDALWFGLGVFSPYGLGTEFDENWPGRYNSYKAFIQTLTVNPTVAFKLNDKVSLAAGMEVMWFDLDLRQKIPTPLGDVDQKLTGDSYGYGFNLGVRYKVCDWMALGAAYRSQVRQHIDGDAEFTKPALLSVYSPSSFLNTGADGSILLPDSVSLGAAFYPTSRLSLEMSGIWTRWSTFDALTIHYDNPITVDRNTGLPVTTVSKVKDWNSVWRLQLGVEYKTTDWLDLRAGYVYDEEPIASDHVDYLVPANDRHLFSFGPGFHWKNWTLDLSYAYLYIKDRDVAARPADYVLQSEFENGDAHLAGISLGYKF